MNVIYLQVYSNSFCWTSSAWLMPRPLWVTGVSLTLHGRSSLLYLGMSFSTNRRRPPVWDASRHGLILYGVEVFGAIKLFHSHLWLTVFVLWVAILTKNPITHFGHSFFTNEGNSVLKDLIVLAMSKKMNIVAPLSTLMIIYTYNTCKFILFPRRSSCVLLSAECMLMQLSVYD